MIGAGLVEALQEVIGAQEADFVAGATGCMPEGTSEKGFADADRADDGDGHAPPGSAGR